MNQQIQKPKILIVEDDGISAAMLKNMLEVKGHEVVAVTDTGNAALSAVQKYQPDLVLMDIMLPGDMNGIETAVRIKETVDIPVLYMTSDDTKERWEQAKATDPYGYILKPIEEKTLHINIQLALQRHQIDRASGLKHATY
jgi:CheY-like chemotaxis protein